MGPGLGVLGAGEATKYPENRGDITTSAAAQSGPVAFAEAGVQPADIDVCMIYDSFSITVLAILEDLGFCKKGEGGPWVEGGRLRSDRPDGPAKVTGSATYGIDAAYNPRVDLRIDGYYARTQTTGAEGDEESYKGTFDFSSDRYGLRAERLKVGAAFTPEVGFVSRDERSGVHEIRYAVEVRGQPVGISEDIIVAGPTDDEITAGTTGKTIIAGRTNQQIIAIATRQPVMVCPRRGHA